MGVEGTFSSQFISVNSSCFLIEHFHLKHNIVIFT